MKSEWEFITRRATVEDLPGVLSCLHEAFAPFRENYTAAAFADTVLTAQTLEGRFRAMPIFLAEAANQQIVGTVACQSLNAGEGHIRGMAVRSAWHGRGVAQKLLEAAERELHACGCLRITLDTTKPLERAIGFYQKNGFHSTGVVADFFGMDLFEFAKTW